MSSHEIKALLVNILDDYIRLGVVNESEFKDIYALVASKCGTTPAIKYKVGSFATTEDGKLYINLMSKLGFTSSFTFDDGGDNLCFEVLSKVLNFLGFAGIVRNSNLINGAWFQNDRLVEFLTDNNVISDDKVKGLWDSSSSSFTSQVLKSLVGSADISFVEGLISGGYFVKFSDEQLLAESCLAHDIILQNMLDSNLPSELVIPADYEEDEYDDSEYTESTTDEADIEDAPKSNYIDILKSRGYSLLTNNGSVGSVQNPHNNILNWLRQFYNPEKPLGGYSCAVCCLNAELLESLGLPSKSSDIWDINVYSKHERLEFRVFKRETDYSVLFLLKLPVGMTSFNFNAGDSRIDFMGKALGGTVFQYPEIKSLKEWNIPQDFIFVSFVVVKDLQKFKNCSWLFKDYLSVVTGNSNESNPFHDYREQVCLGDKIVVGVDPSGLATVDFNCKSTVAAIVGGGTGSGKTVEYDSMVTQALALKGNFGDGSVILIDFKREWIESWDLVGRSASVPIRGYNIETLPTSQVKVLSNVTDKQGNLKELKTDSIRHHMACIMLIKGLFDYIQTIFAEATQKVGSRVEDIKAFNEAGVEVRGFTKLPRIFVFVDEINNMFTSLSPQEKKLFNGMLALAGLTRTSGIHWVVGGQSPTKTVINSIYRNNFGYTILGKMGDADSYEYFGVQRNEKVVEYEKTHSVEIVGSGLFYVGKRDARVSRLVKSLFIQDTDLVNIAAPIVQSSGQSLLNKLIRRAFEDGFLGNVNYIIEGKNNIVPLLLLSKGYISRQEYDNFMTNFYDNASDNNEEFFNTGSTENNFSDNEGFNENTYNQTTDNFEGTDGFDVVETNPNVVNFGGVKRNVTVHCPEISIPNYFDNFTGSNFSSAMCMRSLSEFLFKDIVKVFGGAGRITDVAVKSGYLVLNNVVYSPKVGQGFITSLPVDVKQQIASGRWAYLFSFSYLSKFKQLTSLIVDDAQFAYSKIRKDLYIDRNDSWNKLFKMFKSLTYLQIGSDVIKFGDTIKESEKLGRRSAEIQENVRSKFRLSLPSPVKSVKNFYKSDRVSLPVKVVGTAFGVAGVMVVSSFLGAFALPAVLAVGAVKHALKS